VVRGLRFAFLALVIGMTGTAVAGQDDQPGAWLDAALSGWNTAGMAVPKSTATRTTIDAAVARCKLTTLGSTPAEQAVSDAGWIAFSPFDRNVADHDLEIVGGMVDADETCAPSKFTLFVFAGGTFAGTLSPGLMSPKIDGVAGSVRITGPDAISAEYSRYSRTDPGCCPSSRVRVTFKVERAPQPVVVPVQIRVTR
jgi:hypothetical protein